VSPTARVRLFLLHHAGGTAATYANWPALFPADIAVQAVRFPGRFDGPDEAPFTEIDDLLDALRDALLSELDDRPYALFGHSMGALVAYRLTVEMERGGGPGPVLLGVSGFGRGFHDAVLPSESAGSEEFFAAVAALGGLPPGTLAEPDLARMLEPSLRADFALCSSYRDDGSPVDCPVAGYAGSDDPLLEPGGMREWRARTDRFLGAMEFPGDHFYLETHAVAVAADLARRLRRLAQESVG
jgi:surfactin synthase thioesterase subunit